MTKKDFILIAATIKALPLGLEQKRLVAERFADQLRSTNPNFNRSRFIEACQ